MGKDRSPKVTLSYEEKYLALQSYFEQSISPEDLAGIIGVHRATVYNWLKRIEYNFKNVERLKHPTHKRPRKDKKELSDEIKREIHELLSSHPEMGPLKIKHYFFRHNQVLLSEKEIYRYLKSEGIIESRKRTQQDSLAHSHRFEYEGPLHAVQVDTLYFKLVGGQVIYLITLLDDHSRFVLLSRFVAIKSMDTVIRMLTHALKEYGYIATILTDKGVEFVSWNHFTRFEEYLCSLDIELISSGPKMPFIQGKIERWHQTMREEFEHRFEGFTTLFEAQNYLDKYINYYNYERPHQGIGGLVPADRFFGIARDLSAELAKYTRGDTSDKRIYFCCNIEGQRFVVSGSRNDSLRVYRNNSVLLPVNKEFQEIEHK
jgi:transposase InsO family protein